MPYTSITGRNRYSPTDDVIIADDDQEFTQHSTYTKLKEFELVTPLITSSKFRYYFELSPQGAATAYGRIYRNGVAVGTEQTVAPGVGFTAKTEDIDISGWSVGDKIQLYAHSQNEGTTSSYVQNFRICGRISEWSENAV